MKSHIYRVIAAASVLLPALAFAHPGHDETATFMSGFLHPLLGLDHMLAALAVGLLAAQRKSIGRWALPASFVLAMLAAFIVAREMPAWPAAEMLVAISLIGLGAAYFLGGRVPLLGAIVVTLFGAVHGYVHGIELPGEGNWIVYALGLALATAFAHALGVSIGTRVDPRIRLAAKVAAVMIASAGAALLGMQLAG